MLKQHKDKIEELLDNEDFRGLRKMVEEWEPSEIAAFIDDLEDNKDVLLFRILPRDQAHEVFGHLTPVKQEALVNGLANNKVQLTQLLNTMAPDERTAFLEELPGEVAQRFLNMLSPAERKTAVELLGYPDESIGRLMTTDYVAIHPEWSIEQALEHLRQFGKNSETVNVIYVVDKDWLLIDDLPIRELILSDPDIDVHSIMDERFLSLKASDDQEKAIEMFRQYDRVVLPVVDSKGVLLGIVTVDDVMDVADEEATEDFQKFGSIQETVLHPLHAGIGILYRKRIGWLFVLVIVNVLSGAVIASYESTIQQVVSLVFFLPLLIDSGGNAGSQSATLMVRALALGNVQLKDWVKLVGKEVLISLLLGATMAIGVAGVAGFRAPEILPIVVITMLCIVLWGSIAGLTLPFLFTRFGMDPATASSPLITTICDISGVLIYFSVATWYLGF
ncbi:MAG TPA: magnesium transporter [Balneolaceae bacterium]|nr:magnesium transporter [Balneolaceae bacterium]